MLNVKLIKREREGELLLIGRIDTNTAQDAERIMVDLAGKFDELILNMEQLEYISSAGLRALKAAVIAMRRKGGTIVLKNVGKMVMEVLEVTGFAGMFKFV